MAGPRPSASSPKPRFLKESGAMRFLLAQEAVSKSSCRDDYLGRQNALFGCCRGGVTEGCGDGGRRGAQICRAEPYSAQAWVHKEAGKIAIRQLEMVSDLSRSEE